MGNTIRPRRYNVSWNFLGISDKETLKKGDTESAELAGLMVGKSEHTIRHWQKEFSDNDYQLPSSNRVIIRELVCFGEMRR